MGAIFTGRKRSPILPLPLDRCNIFTLTTKWTITMLNRLTVNLISFCFLALASPFFVTAASSESPLIPTLTPEQLASSAIFVAAITVETNGVETTKEYSANGSIASIIDKFKGTTLKGEFPHYEDGVSNMSGSLSLRGALLTAQTNFTDLAQDGKTYHVETLKICLNATECQDFAQILSQIQGVQGAKKASSNKAVTAVSEDIWDQLVDWLKGKGGTSLLSTIADTWVEKTSIDPVAGNPNSLMGQLTKANFNLATNGILMGNTSGLDLFSVAPSYSQNTSNNHTIKTAYLPLKYSHYFNSDNAMFVTAPISYNQVEQAQTYSLALGLGYTHVFIRNPHVVWALTPSVYAGAVGSVDLGSGTLLYDGALASRVLIPYGAFTYGITNDLSYLKTAKVKIGDVETPYDMKNVLTSNGFDVTYHLHKNFSVGGFYTMTNVLSGIDWYVNSYNEVGFKLAKLTDYKSAMYDHMTLSAGYLFGKHGYKGGSLTLGFNL